MNNYIIVWRITLGSLLFHTTLYAENVPLFDKVSSYDWFKDITKGQKAWLKKASQGGLKTTLPINVDFYSISNSFNIYKTAKLEHPIEKHQAIPGAIGYESVIPNTKGEFAGNRGSLILQKFSGDRVLVTYKNTTGWIKRSTIRISSIIITSEKGDYARDIFPTYRAGGNIARLRIESKNDKIYFVVRYVKNWRSEDEKYFGFQYDVDKNNIRDIVEWNAAGSTIVTQKPIENLISADAVNILAEQVGLGKTGFVKFTTGKLGKMNSSYSTVSKKTRALIHGKHLFINAWY